MRVSGSCQLESMNSCEDTKQNQISSTSFTATSLPSVILKGSENYAEWSPVMKQFLMSKDLWNVIQSLKIQQKDTRKDTMAKANIVLSIDGSLYSHVMEAKSARETWMILKNTFGVNSESEKVSLWRKLMSVSLSSCGSVEAYMDEVKSVTSRMKDVGLEISDELLDTMLEAGLSDNCKSAAEQFENSSRSFAGVLRSKPLPVQDIVNSSVVLPEKRTVDGRRKRNKTCFVCRSKDHLVKTCPVKKSKAKKESTAVRASTEVDRKGCHKTSKVDGGRERIDRQAASSWKRRRYDLNANDRISKTESIMHRTSLCELEENGGAFKIKIPHIKATYLRQTPSVLMFNGELFCNCSQWSTVKLKSCTNLGLRGSVRIDQSSAHSKCQL